MIITLSPAKILDFETPVATLKHSVPQYTDESRQLNDYMLNLSISDIADLMRVNARQALQVYEHIQTFHSGNSMQKQAAFTYNGIAFQGLDIQSFSERDLTFAQQHLIILSGLYGILRPLDLIKPYRLEMQIKLENNRGGNLYDFWKSTLTAELTQRLQKDDNIWINLASDEYSKVIDTKMLPEKTRIITPVFKQQDENGYRQVVVYAKKARGMMAGFILKNRIKKVTDLKAFDEEGYFFMPSLSNNKEWVFVR